MVRVLQLLALNDDNTVLMKHSGTNGEKRLLQVGTPFPLIEHLNPKNFVHKKLIIGGVNNPFITNLEADVIVNAIGDADRFAHALEKLDHTAYVNYPVVINHPHAVHNTCPDKLYTLLEHSETLLHPKTVKIQPKSLDEVKAALQENEIRTPFICKEASSPTGRCKRVLVKCDDDLYQLEQFAFDGRDYYLSQFIDYRSKDGLYRKYRFYVIGNKIIPGFLIVSKQWEIHNDEQAHQELLKALPAIEEEEKNFLKQFKKKTLHLFKEIKEKTLLDYFAVDCTFDKQNKPVIFKVSTEKHFLSDEKKMGYYSQKQINALFESYENMLIEKLQNRDN